MMPSESKLASDFGRQDHRSYEEVMQPDAPAIFGLLNTTLKQTTDTIESLRKSGEETKSRLSIIEEKVKRMASDQDEIKIELRERAKDLKDRIDTLEKNIVGDQKKRSNTIIAIQSTILLLLVGGFISYFFLFLPHPH